MRTTQRLSCLAVLLALVCSGCGEGGRGRMVSVPPPTSWKATLLSDRIAKDHGFRQDPAAPLLPEDRKDFQGLDYWPPDAKYRLVGPLHINADPQTFEIATTSGKLRPAQKYGHVRFDLNGEHVTLQVYRMLDSVAGDDNLFLPFADGTTGKETYPAGRYVDLEGEPGGLYVLDFNRAYNPYCAYGEPERYVCPATPSENKLPVRIESGEYGFKTE